MNNMGALASDCYYVVLTVLSERGISANLHGLVSWTHIKPMTGLKILYISMEILSLADFLVYGKPALYHHVV